MRDGGHQRFFRLVIGQRYHTAPPLQELEGLSKRKAKGSGTSFIMGLRPKPRGGLLPPTASVRPVVGFGWFGFLEPDSLASLQRAQNDVEYQIQVGQIRVSKWAMPEYRTEPAQLL